MVNNTPKKIIVHHLNGMAGNARGKTQHHTAETIDVGHSLRWPGFTSKMFRNKRGRLFHVGYHFVIEQDGTIVQTRALNEEGAHTIGMNRSSIGVAVCGNFDQGVEEPTMMQMMAFKKVYEQIRAHSPHLTKQDIVPHRHYAPKSCFGSGLSDVYFAELVDEETKDKDKMIQYIDYLQRLVALLTQLISLKRMSKRESFGSVFYEAS